jgi:Cys-tRNA synthase (O-phospho-L-seryl-tRNA:Cys-tRNA synthase)
MRAKSVAILGDAELAAADVFLDAGAEIKRQTKDREEAKETLLAGLGDRKVGVLPDGRTVTKIVKDFEATTIERKAYSSTSLEIA